MLMYLLSTKLLCFACICFLMVPIFAAHDPVVCVWFPKTCFVMHTCVFVACLPAYLLLLAPMYSLLQTDTFVARNAYWVFPHVVLSPTYMLRFVLMCICCYHLHNVLYLDLMRLCVVHMCLCLCRPQPVVFAHMCFCVWPTDIRFRHDPV